MEKWDEKVADVKEALQPEKEVSSQNPVLQPPYNLQITGVIAVYMSCLNILSSISM